MKYTKTLSDDLNSKLPDVERTYLRIPVTIIISMLLMIIVTPISIYDTWIDVYKEFFVPCWKGIDKNSQNQT